MRSGEPWKSRFLRRSRFCDRAKERDSAMTSDKDSQTSGFSDPPGAEKPGLFVERRSGADRRQRPTPALSVLRSGGQRRAGRRQGDTERTYVDHFTPGDVALLLSIFLLNIFDALFTLLWLQRGGAEANPFMAFLLEMGEGAFLLQKCIVVGIWLVILLIHKNFRLARIGLYSLAAVYTLVILGHFALMTSGVDPAQPPVVDMDVFSSEEAGQ